MTVEHNHLLVNGFTRKPPTNEKDFELWLTNLVKDINMKVAVPARAAYVNNKGNKGMTAIVGIKTSHIACHFWDEPNPAVVRFDLYTCGPLPTNKVMDILQKDLGLFNYKMVVLDRADGFDVIDKTKGAIK